MKSNLLKESMGDRQPIIVLVGGDDEILDRALALGLKVFLLQAPDKIMNVQHPGVVGMLVIDYTSMVRKDVAEVARTLAFLYDVKCAVSLTEYGSLPAAWINETLVVCVKQIASYSVWPWHA